MDPLLDSGNPAIYALRTTAAGPTGSLPLEANQLRHISSGDLFGLTQNAGMGWNPAPLRGKQFLILRFRCSAGRGQVAEIDTANRCDEISISATRPLLEPR